MADQPDVFEEQNKPKPEGDNQAKPEETPPTSTPSPDDVFADQLASIRNEEGKPKYDSVQKALEALNHSQEYIPQLKTELQQREERINALERELEKRGSVEDVVTRLTEKREQDPPRDEGAPPQSAGLDEQTVEKLFEDMLTRKQQEQLTEQNKRQVQDSLYERYGEKTQDVVAQKAQELGVTAKELGELAGRNPKMVQALFGESRGGSPKPSTSSLNIPPNRQPEDEEIKLDKSYLRGASGKDQAELMRKIKERVYKRYGVENK